MKYHFLPHKIWKFGEIELQLDSFNCKNFHELLDIHKMGLKIKCCPFCGSPPNVIMNKGILKFSVICLPCQARFKKDVLEQQEGKNPFLISSGPFHWAYTLKKALELWNYRSQTIIILKNGQK